MKAAPIPTPATGPFRLILNANQVDDMLHALGQSHAKVVPAGSKVKTTLGFRNYFMTDRPSPDMKELCFLGLMSQNRRNPHYFHVTEDGIKALGVKVDLQ